MSNACEGLAVVVQEVQRILDDGSNSSPKGYKVIW